MDKRSNKNIADRELLEVFRRCEPDACHQPPPKVGVGFLTAQSGAETLEPSKVAGWRADRNVPSHCQILSASFLLMRPIMYSASVVHTSHNNITRGTGYFP